MQRANVEGWRWRNSEPGSFYYLRNSLATLPVGAGPFAVAGVREGNVYELIPNPHYHGKRPEFATLELRNEDEYVDPLVHFEANVIDVFHLGNIFRGYPESYFAPDNRDGRIVYTEDRGELEFIAFNDAIEPFDDVEFRRALATALDRFRSFSYPQPGSRATAGDLEGARAHLSRSAVSETVQDFVLTLRTDAGYNLEWPFDEVAQAWNANLRIESRYEPISTAAFDDLSDNGQIEFILDLVEYQFPEDASIIEQVVQKLGSIAHGPAAKNAIVLLAEARSTVDPVERQLKYRAVGDALLDQALVVPIGWSGNLDVTYVRNGIEGYGAPKFGGSRFAGVRVTR